MIMTVPIPMTSFSQHESCFQSKVALKFDNIGLLVNESLGKGPHDSPVLVYPVHP